jgi:hypothetical protein
VQPSFRHETRRCPKPPAQRSQLTVTVPGCQTCPATDEIINYLGSPPFGYLTKAEAGITRWEAAAAAQVAGSWPTPRRRRSDAKECWTHGLLGCACARNHRAS